LLEFSPDDRYIATACSNGLAQVWDTQTGNAASPPMRHPSFAYYATISPDNRQLVTRGAVHDLRVWDVSTGDLLGSLGAGFGAIWFDSTGSSVIGMTKDGPRRVRVPTYQGRVEHIERMARLYSGQYLDEHEGVAFVPMDEFIVHRDDYRKAWLDFQNLPDDPARQPSE
jgi:WD40 repeat protein